MHRWVLVAGATVALVAGGGLAWADWTVGGSAAVATAESARIPVMGQPVAELSGSSAKISWTEVRLSPGWPVGGYVVLRQDGADSAVACTAAANQTHCRDRAARPGSIVTYVVHATAGVNWVGEDSEPSDPVGIPDAGGDHKTGGTDQAPAATETRPVREENSAAAGPTPSAPTDPVPSESVSPGASPSGSASPAAPGDAGGP